MARLYRVRHAVLGTFHALKVLDPVYREQAEVRDRFLSEALIGARLNHPHIVRVTDTVSTDEVAGIVMELVRGPNLDQYIHLVRGPGNPLSPAEMRALFLHVLDAVGAAHRQGIVHRDLKPANILLEPIPDGFCPKVTDFGIAKLLAAAAELRRDKGATRADARMGTLAYMSPEQIKGAAAVTPRSDIFSLGATLYEMATGTTAFGGPSDFEVMQRIVEGRFEPLPQSGHRDPVIAAAIRRALEPDPESRFPSCEEFAAALTTPERRPPTVRNPERHRDLPQEGRSPPSSGQALPAKPSGARREEAATPPAPPSRFSPGWVAIGGAMLLVGGMAWFGREKPSRVNQQSPPPAAPEKPAAAPPPISDTWTGPRPFDYCPRKRTASGVAVTYLTANKGFQDADEIRSWFRRIPAAAVQVYLLERKNGARLVSFEIHALGWDRWSMLTGGASGEEICWRIGKGLIDLGVGRPGKEGLNEDGSKYEFDFFDEQSWGPYPIRRPLGDLDLCLSATGVMLIRTWLAGPDMALPAPPPDPLPELR